MTVCDILQLRNATDFGNGAIPLERQLILCVMELCDRDTPDWRDVLAGVERLDLTASEILRLRDACTNFAKHESIAIAAEKRMVQLVMEQCNRETPGCAQCPGGTREPGPLCQHAGRGNLPDRQMADQAVS